MAKTIKKSWKIGGRTFELRPQVYGQLDQIGELLEDAVGELAAMRMDGSAAATSLALKACLKGGRMELFAAIVLREKGKPLADKDLDELARHMVEHLDGAKALGVVDAFFGLPGVAEEIEAARRARNKLTRLVAQDVVQLAKKAAALQSGDSSGKASSSSARETAQGGSGSCGR